ncbi:MAG: hypothetical protein HON32_01240 [Francisellaceae bacterium]|nr:hypothetical protein [Francisellaceae bacterium]
MQPHEDLTSGIEGQGYYYTATHPDYNLELRILGSMHSVPIADIPHRHQESILQSNTLLSETGDKEALLMTHNDYNNLMKMSMRTKKNIDWYSMLSTDNKNLINEFCKLIPERFFNKKWIISNVIVAYVNALVENHQMLNGMDEDILKEFIKSGKDIFDLDYNYTTDNDMNNGSDEALFADEQESFECLLENLHDIKRSNKFKDAINKLSLPKIQEEYMLAYEKICEKHASEEDDTNDLDYPIQYFIELLHKRSYLSYLNGCIHTLPDRFKDNDDPELIERNFNWLLNTWMTIQPSYMAFHKTKFIVSLVGGALHLFDSYGMINLFCLSGFTVNRHDHDMKITTTYNSTGAALAAQCYMQSRTFQVLKEQIAGNMHHYPENRLILHAYEANLRNHAKVKENTSENNRDITSLKTIKPHI